MWCSESDTYTSPSLPPSFPPPSLPPSLPQTLFLSLCSHPVNGKVVFSSSEDMENNVKKISGTVTEQGKEESHTIPGML